MLEDKDRIQDDLNKSELQTEDMTTFSSGKCKMPYLVSIN